MVLKMFLYILLCFINYQVIAQNITSFSISGNVVSKSMTPIDYVSLVLYNATDSSLVFEKFTDENGGFLFSEVEVGRYFIKANLLSNQKILVPIINVIDKNIEMQNIEFSDDGLLLNTIEIIATIPAIKRSTDHVTLNVKDSYLSTSAYETFELMNLLPNINANSEGIKVKNSTNILYLIDGRGTRNSNEINRQRIFSLKQQEIDKIEVYSNPPARFDADGSSVINVITIKNTKLSNITTTNKMGLWQNNLDGNSFGSRNELNLNYKIGKVGVYTNLNIMKSLDVQSRLEVVKYKESSSILSQNINQTYNSLNFGVNTGAVYKLNENKEIIIDYSLTVHGPNNSGRLLRSTSLLYMRENAVDSSLMIQTRDTTSFDFHNFNIGYWFNNSKFVYDIQVYYDSYNTKNQGFAFIGNNSPYKTSENQNNYSIVINVQDTIARKIEVRAGIKNSFTDVKNYTFNTLNSGLFHYQEAPIAIYSQLSGNSFNIDWNVGLRAESTSWKIIKPQPKNDAYFNLFPSLFLTKNFNKISINASYSRRIRRQNISELNPIINYSKFGIYSTVEGNVDVLKPQFTDSYEFNFDFKYVNISTYFTHMKNARIYYPVSTDTLVVNYLPQSVSFEDTYGMNFKVPLSYKQIRANINYNIDFIQTKLVSDGLTKGLSQNINVTLSYKYRSLSFSTSLSYSFREKYSYYNNAPNWGMYTGIRFSKKDSPLSFSLNISDVFGRKYNFIYNYPLLSSQTGNTSVQRLVNVALIYNFKLGKDFDKKSFEGISR